MRLIGLVAAAALWLCGPAAADGLHVDGNRLLDAQGRQLTLRGVDRSGTEYACVGGWGISDGPRSATSLRAMVSWHIDFVRVPLNEDCWLGINGVKRRLGGAAYRRAIVGYVNLLHQFGMSAELSLMWGAPGRQKAISQPPAPDADHSPAMWASLARTFKNDSNVILAPWGEPLVDANCLLRGGACATYRRTGQPYRAAGMQQAVDTMRRAGYRGVIAIPGLNYANDLSQWLSHEPNDPLHQLIAEAHVYGKNACSSVTCLDATMAPVAQVVPLIFAEVGETYDSSSCASVNTAVFLTWAAAHHVGSAAWTWDTWGTCGSLISNYNGQPANAYGRFVRAFYTGGATVSARAR